MRVSIPDNKLVRLGAPKRYYIPNTDTKQAFDNLLHLAAQIYLTALTLITLVNSGCQWFSSNVRPMIPETHRDLIFYVRTILQSKLLIVEDTLVDQCFATNPLVKAEPNIRFYSVSTNLKSKFYGRSILLNIQTQPFILLHSNCSRERNFLCP